MSRSLAEHLAVAPEPIRRSIVGLVAMCEMSGAERKRAVRPFRESPYPGVQKLADEILAALPPPGLTGQALADAELVLVAEQLGERHGGKQWLIDSGRWPPREAMPGRLEGTLPDASDGGPAR